MICKSRAIISLLIALLLFPLLTDRALAQRERGENRRSAEKVWESAPLFYDANGSYYQLVVDFSTHNSGANWSEAKLLAEKRTHEGRKGRLALLNSPELFQWISSNFNFIEHGHGGNTWIGLRYWCGYRRLTTAGGDTYSFQNFTAWDIPWYREGGARCGVHANLTFMGVFINGKTGRWKAAGELKRYPSILIEYPPEKQSDSAQSSDG